MSSRFIGAHQLRAQGDRPSRCHRIAKWTKNSHRLMRSELWQSISGEVVAQLGYARGRNIDVLVANGYPPALAAKRGTTIPIVAINAGDPAGTGPVDSLVRPNMTGISDVSAELTPKRMELLKLMAPRLRRVAILWNTDDLGMTVRYRARKRALN